MPGKQWLSIRQVSLSNPHLLSNTGHVVYGAGEEQSTVILKTWIFLVNSWERVKWDVFDYDTNFIYLAEFVWITKEGSQIAKSWFRIYNWFFIKTIILWAISCWTIENVKDAKSTIYHCWQLWGAAAVSSLSGRLGKKKIL